MHTYTAILQASPSRGREGGVNRPVGWRPEGRYGGGEYWEDMGQFLFFFSFFFKISLASSDFRHPQKNLFFLTPFFLFISMLDPGVLQQKTQAESKSGWGLTQNALCIVHVSRNLEI